MIAKSEKLEKEFSSSRLKIVIAGVGGGGNNTIKRLIHLGVSGPELVAINTDSIHLNTVPKSAKRILIGEKITRGLGAGGFPDVAEKAAEASKGKLKEALKDANVVFLCAGMGGGTGTGAGPVVAQIAKEMGAIVIAMITYPFKIERARLERAFDGIENLRKVTNTLVVIDNNKLLEFVPNLPIEQAFMVADEIIARAIRGISDTLLKPSLINLDFADLRNIMGEGGISMIAVGEGKGINKVEETVRNTLDHKLLDIDPTGAKGILIHLTGGRDMTLGEANQIGEMLVESCDPNAEVIWGARMDDNFKERIEAIAIFTGLKEGPAILDKRAEKQWGIKKVE